MNTHSSDFIGTDKIPRLLLKFATPAIISISINSLYNIVDRLYIGRGVGADAMAGLALTFPFMIILMAFGMLVGQGSAATVSLLLGEQRREDADRVVGQAFALFLLFVVSVQILALIFLDKILLLFGGTPQAIPYAHDYLAIVLWGNIFQHISFGMSNVIRAEGSANKAMYIILLGAILNIVLDPLFIFTFHMGIKGAALATVLSMMASSTWVIIHFAKGHGVLHLRLHEIRIFPKLFSRVLSIGMAPCLMQIVHCGVVVFFNHSFNHFAADENQATLAIAAFGIVNSIMMFMLMPAFGIMQGTQPIIGYNYGAKLYHRVRKALKLAVNLSSLIGVVLAILMLLAARPLCACFSKDEDCIALGMYMLRAGALGFLFIGGSIVIGNYFQAIGRAGLALIMSLIRQVFLLLPALYIIPRLCGFYGILWAGPASDTLSGLLFALFYYIEYRKLKKLEAKA